MAVTVTTAVHGIERLSVCIENEAHFLQPKSSSYSGLTEAETEAEK